MEFSYPVEFTKFFFVASLIQILSFSAFSLDSSQYSVVYLKGPQLPRRNAGHVGVKLKLVANSNSFMN